MCIRLNKTVTTIVIVIGPAAGALRGPLRLDEA